MSNQKYDFKGKEFNVFEEQIMWWNENALTIQGRLEELEGRLFGEEMTANQNDLDYLYKLAFLNYDARYTVITMKNNILSRLEGKGIKDGLKDYIHKYDNLNPYDSDINYYKTNDNVSQGEIHNIAKLLWYALVTLSKGSAFNIFKAFVDQSPFNKNVYNYRNITKEKIEEVFLGSEDFKQYRYKEDEGYIRYVGKKEEFVYKKTNTKTESVLNPVPEETELMLTTKTKDLVTTMLELLAKSSKNVSYTLAPLKKMDAQYGFASQVSQQLEIEKDTRKILVDVTSKQMYMCLDTKWYFVGSKTNLNKNDTEKRLWTEKQWRDRYGEDKIFQLQRPKNVKLKFPLYAEEAWFPFQKKFFKYADELHLSEKKEIWSDISRKNLEGYISRWEYVLDSYKLTFKEKGWKDIRDKRAADVVDKALRFNFDDENNETYNFGRVVLQNDQGKSDSDDEGDSSNVYEPNFLKLFWEANKPPEVVATNDKIDELGKTIASHWIYFRDSLDSLVKKKSDKLQNSIKLDQVKKHVTELHDSMEPALQKLSTFLMGEVVQSRQELERYLMSEKKIIYKRNVSDSDNINEQFNISDFVKKLDVKKKKALMVFLLGYYTLEDSNNENDFHDNLYLADRIKKGKNNVLHFMLYESFLNNVFEQKTIAYDAFVNFLHTDAGKKNSYLTQNKIATEYPCYYTTPRNIVKYETAIHNGEYFNLRISNGNMINVSKFDVNLRGVPWSANLEDVADKDYWLAFENYRTIFFYWNTLYYVLKKLTEQLADELDLKNVYQTYLRMYTEDRIAEQLVSDLEYKSVRKNEKFSERKRLRIFQSKTKTQIGPLAKELDEENQKKIAELYTFAILESKKRINKERDSPNMTDEDVDNILKEYLEYAKETTEALPAYLLNRGT